MKREIKRKIIHLLLGILLAILIFYDIIDASDLGIITIIAIILLAIEKKRRLPVIGFLLDQLERPDIRKRFPGKGPLFFLIGTGLTLLLFPKDIAVASILILAIGDSVPYLFYLTSQTSSYAALSGLLIGTLLCFLSASLFVSIYEALAASVIAIITERIDSRLGLKNIDDNLIVPIIAGSVMYLIRVL